MKQEKYTFTATSGCGSQFELFLDDNRGAYLTVRDLERIFSYDFSDELERILDGSALEIVQSGADQVQLITIPVMIDCFYSAQAKLDKGNLYNWLFAIEAALLSNRGGK